MLDQNSTSSLVSEAYIINDIYSTVTPNPGVTKFFFWQDHHLRQTALYTPLHIFPQWLPESIFRMKFPWPTSRASSACSDPETGDVPLGNMQRLSTETQTLNGFRQSNLPDHGDPIIEDIKNGK